MGWACTRDMSTACRLHSIASGTGKPFSPSAFMNANSFNAASLDRYSQLK